MAEDHQFNEFAAHGEYAAINATVGHAAQKSNDTGHTTMPQPALPGLPAIEENLLKFEIQNLQKRIH